MMMMMMIMVMVVVVVVVVIIVKAIRNNYWNAVYSKQLIVRGAKLLAAKVFGAGATLFLLTSFPTWNYLHDYLLALGVNRMGAC
jgi:heme/copper-type cytochrome/quinol oxidase subunit 2